MSQTNAVKVSAPVMVQLRDAAEHHNRSIAGQAEYWMRLGQAVEKDPRFGFTRVDQALRGVIKTNQLSDAEMDMYFDLLPYQPPRASVVAAYAELGARPGAWGMDEAGNLVQSGERPA